METLTGFGDLEALSIDPASNTLYAGFDDDASNGSILAAFKIDYVDTSNAVENLYIVENQFFDKAKINQGFNQL